LQRRLCECRVGGRICIKVFEVRKADTHGSRLRIGCSDRGTFGIADSFGMKRKSVPEPIEVNPFASCRELFCIRAEKMKVPRCRKQQHRLPRTDAGDRSVHQCKFRDIAAKLRGVGVGGFGPMS
jgi:hypothetical protein